MCGTKYAFEKDKLEPQVVTDLSQFDDGFRSWSKEPFTGGQKESGPYNTKSEETLTGSVRSVEKRNDTLWSEMSSDDKDYNWKLRIKDPEIAKDFEDQFEKLDPSLPIEVRWNHTDKKISVTQNQSN